MNTNTISIPTEIHLQARTFATKQDNPKQTYFNTLAVYATQTFLTTYNISTHWEDSDSWYPGIMTEENVADLVVTDIGKIECRAVILTSESDEEAKFTLPESAWKDRILYVAVRIEENLSSVRLLGYSPILADQAVSYPIHLANLKPIEDLPNHLRIISEKIEEFEKSPISAEVETLIGDLQRAIFVAQLERIANDEKLSDTRKKIQARQLLTNKNSTHLVTITKQKNTPTESPKNPTINPKELDKLAIRCLQFFTH